MQNDAAYGALRNAFWSFIFADINLPICWNGVRLSASQFQNGFLNVLIQKVENLERRI